MPKKIIVPNEIEAAIMAAFNNGQSTRDIANAASVSTHTVKMVILKNGGEFLKERIIAQIRAKAIGRPSGAKGRKHTPDEIARMVATKKANGKPRLSGYKHSPETLQRISAALKALDRRLPEGEKKQREAIRQASKRFITRVLRATGKRKEIPSEKYLGYSTKVLHQHLGGKPTDDAHIDHYVPIAEFLRRGITDVSVINALPNLRWLSAHENRAKRDTPPPDADAVIQMCLTAHFMPSGVTYTRGLT